VTKATLQGIFTKFTVSLKRIFPLKTQVVTDINTAKTAAIADSKTYTDQKVIDATDGAATTAYVDGKETSLLSKINTNTSNIDGIFNSIDNYQMNMNDRIDQRVSKLGSFIGVSATYAGLPTADQLGKAYTNGDFAHLTAKDGAKKKGLYRYDGTSYVFITGDPSVVEMFTSLKYASIDDTNDDKFVTGKYLKDRETANELSQAEVDSAVDAA